MTEAGQRQFAEWIAAFVGAGPRADQLRSPLLLALFFGGFVPSPQLASLVQEYRWRHQRSLAIAEDMLGALAGDTSLPGTALLRRAAYETMMIDWLGQVLSRIPLAGPEQRTRAADPSSRP